MQTSKWDEDGKMCTVFTNTESLGAVFQSTPSTLINITLFPDCGLYLSAILPRVGRTDVIQINHNWKLENSCILRTAHFIKMSLLIIPTMGNKYSFWM